MLTDVYAEAGRPPPGDPVPRVRDLIAAADGLALYAVATPESYPPDLVERIIDTQLDLLCGGADT